jgi:hypothetical protein
MRRPAGRGHGTFAPLPATDYETWRRRRGRLDQIVEVTVQGGVPEPARYLVDRWQTAPCRTLGLRA